MVQTGQKEPPQLVEAFRSSEVEWFYSFVFNTTKLECKSELRSHLKYGFIIG